MKILALITARGGSKRVLGKNIRSLGGKPLIAWTIDGVAGLNGICDILVSTDDEAIAITARASGAIAPWLRPAELSSDTASSVDVSLHALGRYEVEHGAVDAVLLLQPTSPFRRRQSIQRGIDLYRQDASCAVVGVSPASSHPEWCFKIVDGTLQSFIETARLGARSQDLPLAYVINGAFYMLSPDRLRRRQSFLGENLVPLIMPGAEERIDIDTEEDWTLAEAMSTLLEGNVHLRQRAEA